MDYREVTEIRDGMRIDWDMPIPTDDGIVLRCDLYRPIEDGKYPVIMTYGPYGKWLHFDDLYRDQWRRMCETIEWAGTQPWSNGKVGLNGISYYGQNQWQTSALQPKHLAAICIWEGAADFYRDMAHHG